MFKLKQILGIANKNPKLFQAFSEKIICTRSVSKHLVLCPTQTQGSWLGVNIATNNLFGESTVEIPQYYSNSVLSDKELTKIASIIASLDFQNVIFSGFCPFHATLAKEIKQKNSSVNIGVILHGALSELADNITARATFHSIVQLSNDGIISKIGYVKFGIGDTLKQITNVPCFHIILQTPFLVQGKKHQFPYKINIGIFGNHGFNKNLYNQIAAVELIDGACAHILDSNDSGRYKMFKKTMIHPNNLSRKDFISLLGSMDLNMHLSFSESWGQIVTESLMLGVPCLTSNNNGIFEHDQTLKRQCVVNTIDNPQLIANRIIDCINQKIEPKIMKDYIINLNKLSQDSVNNFLDT